MNIKDYTMRLSGIELVNANRGKELVIIYKNLS